MAENSSLLLTEAKLTDQRTFTCMVVAGADIPEYPVNVVIYSEYELEYHFSASLSARIQYVNTFFFFVHRRDANRPDDYRQSGGTGDWQAHKGEFLMINIAYTYSILGRKASREIPHLS